MKETQQSEQQARPAGPLAGGFAGTVPGLLASIATNADTPTPEVLAEMREALSAPDDSLSKMARHIVRDRPELLPTLSPEAREAIQISRLSMMLAHASTDRRIDGETLLAIWETEPSRDILFPEDVQVAIRRIANNASHYCVTPSRLAAAIVKSRKPE